MDRRIRIAGIAAALAFSVWVLTSPTDTIPIPIPEPPTGGPDDTAIVLASNLERPRDIAIYGDDVYLAEREGRIWLIRADAMIHVGTLRTIEDFDAGLMGITVHPEFDENGMLYVYLTHADGETVQNRIMEIHVIDDRIYSAEVILDGIPASRFANGGAIAFGPDHMLYVGTGTPSEASHLPQDPESLAGKILRIKPDGTIPDDNPTPDSPIYSMGHRSVSGMAWDVSGTMYAIEAGPDKNDEINVIVGGGNYGWPDVQCAGGGYVDAILCYDPAIEPGGIIFSSGTSATPGYMIVSSLRAASLFEVDADEGLHTQKVILGGVGRIRDVEQSADGILYVITSNTDGKGFASDTDDILLMIRE